MIYLHYFIFVDLVLAGANHVMDRTEVVQICHYEKEQQGLYLQFFLKKL